MPPANPSQVCEVCGARAATLRRGRCWICYVRWADDRPVGLGASCAVCYDRRRENLRLIEFQGAWLPMCHNCSAKTLRLSPVPRSIDGVRQRLSRDRRWKSRRQRRKDHRIFAFERRDDEWRRPREPDSEWLDAEDLIVEIQDAEDLPTEATSITSRSRLQERPSVD